MMLCHCIREPYARLKKRPSIDLVAKVYLLGTQSFGLNRRSSRADKSGVGDSVQREAEAFPLVVSAAQRTDALDAQLVQGHGGLGGRGLAGAGTEEHYEIGRAACRGRGE